MNQHLRTTWKYLRRAPYQAITAFAVMTLVFFLSSLIILVATGSHALLKYFESRPQVTAFFKDEITSGDIENLKIKLNQTGKIKQLKYVSKEEALLIYQEQNKADPLLLEMVTASVLPSSLEVSTIEIVYMNEIAQILKDEPQVEEVIFQEDIVKSLKNWTSNIRIIGLVLVILLFGLSFMVILVIIGMKVTIRKKEIEILPLIGATKNYIRVPFLLEGIIYGAVSAFIGWGLCYLVLLYSTPFLVQFLAGLPLLPIPFLLMLAVLASQLIAGIVIGSLSSLLAIKRYLR